MKTGPQFLQRDQDLEGRVTGDLQKLPLSGVSLGQDSPSDIYEAGWRPMGHVPLLRKQLQRSAA